MKNSSEIQKTVENISNEAYYSFNLNMTILENENITKQDIDSLNKIAKLAKIARSKISKRAA